MSFYRRLTFSMLIVAAASIGITEIKGNVGKMSRHGVDLSLYVAFMGDQEKGSAFRFTPTTTTTPTRGSRSGAARYWIQRELPNRLAVGQPVQFFLPLFYPR